MRESVIARCPASPKGSRQTFRVRCSASRTSVLSQPSSKCFAKLIRLTPNGDSSNGFPLFFMPGMDGTGQSILPQVSRLVHAGFDVHCLYVPPEDRSSWKELTDTTHSLVTESLRSQRQKRALIVSESFGACLSLRLAQKAPELLEGLVLLNPATSFNISLGGLPALISLTNLLGLFPESWYRLAQSILLPLLVDDDLVGPEGKRALEQMISMRPPALLGQPLQSDGIAHPANGSWFGQQVGLGCAPSAAAQHRVNLLREGNVTQTDLMQINVPTVVFASARDRLFPSLLEGARLQRHMPRAKRLILPNSCHAALLETSINLADLLRRAAMMPQAQASASPGSSSAAPPGTPSASAPTSNGMHHAARSMHHPLQAQLPLPTTTSTPQHALGTPFCTTPNSQLGAVSQVLPGIPKVCLPSSTSTPYNADMPVLVPAMASLSMPSEANPVMVTAIASSSPPSEASTPINVPAMASSPPPSAAAAVAAAVPDVAVNAVARVAGSVAERSAAGVGALLASPPAAATSLAAVSGKQHVTATSPVAVPGKQLPAAVLAEAGAGAAAELDTPVAMVATAAVGRAAATDVTKAPPAAAVAIPVTPEAATTAPAVPTATTAPAAPAVATITATALAATSSSTAMNLGLVDEVWDDASQFLAPWRDLVSPIVLDTHHLPSPSTHQNCPILFVGNHQKMGLYDMPLLMYELYVRGFQVKGLAHPGHWSSPLGSVFERFGAVKATPRAAYKLLRNKEQVLLFPGGAKEVNKRREEEYQLLWQDTPDFVRLAARFNTIIVPFAAVGADDAYDVMMEVEDILNDSVLGPVLTTAIRRFDPALHPQEALLPLTRLPGLGLPSLIPVPNLQRLYFKFCEPVDTRLCKGASPEDMYEQVKGAVESGIQELLLVRSQDKEAQLGARLEASLKKCLPSVGLGAAATDS